MKRLIYTIILIILLSGFAFAGDHFGDYLNDQVPQDYEYPLWLKIFGDYILRLLIGGMIFFSVSGFPKNKLFSFRGLVGIIFSFFFLVLSIVFQNYYYFSLEMGIKVLVLLIGGLLLFALIINGMLKLREKNK